MFMSQRSTQKDSIHFRLVSLVKMKIKRCVKVKAKAITSDDEAENEFGRMKES